MFNSYMYSWAHHLLLHTLVSQAVVKSLIQRLKSLARIVWIDQSEYKFKYLITILRILIGQFHQCEPRISGPVLFIQAFLWLRYYSNKVDNICLFCRSNTRISSFLQLPIGNVNDFNDNKINLFDQIVLAKTQLINTMGGQFCVGKNKKHPWQFQCQRN